MTTEPAPQRLPRSGGEPLPAGLLEVERLSVRVGGTPVLREVSFSVRAGERVGLIGESGSGKSVTALAVMGLLPEGMEATGSVRLAGEDLLAASEKRRSELRGDRLSMVFQEPMSALNPLMRVGRQVGEVLSIHRGVPRRAAARQAVALLGRVGLPDPAGLARAYPHQLSGGQRQRVMLAMALSTRPALVLADEPTTALDVTVQAQVLALLDQLVDEQQSALVLISHDLAVVSTLCERLLVMYGGAIVESGTVAELLGSPRHPYTGGLVATAAAISPERRRDGRPLAAIAGSVPELGRFPSGCVFRSRCGRASDRCATAPALGSPDGGRDHLTACWHPLGSSAEPAVGAGAGAGAGAGSSEGEAGGTGEGA